LIISRKRCCIALVELLSMDWIVEFNDYLWVEFVR
jgi:hypothetical protein